MNLTFQQKTDNFAEIALKIGVGLKPGQRLLVCGSIENADFIRLVTKKAYTIGARLVEVLWEDDEINLTRLQFASPDSLSEAPRISTFALNDASTNTDAVLWIRSSNPDLLGNIHPDLVHNHQTAIVQARTAYYTQVALNRFNWCVISLPIQPWAQRIFPALSAEEAMNQMWDAVFKIVRADTPDPIAAWQQHNEKLRQIRTYLNQQQYTTLELKGGGTDLSIGLPENHVWGGGAHQLTEGTHQGLIFTANIPTEEVWTLPHRKQVNGVAKASKPLNYSGVLITDIEIHFQNGRIVEAKASHGEETLKQLIATDEGAHYLGEVALVPHSSPISQSGLLFYNTLYDENAASHIAIGKAYRNNLEDGTTMSSEAFEAAGGNISLVHVDWMIGHKQMDIWGIKKDGTRETVMSQGEWAFLDHLPTDQPSLVSKR